MTAETDADAVDVRRMAPEEFLAWVEMKEAAKARKLAAIRESLTEGDD